MQAPSNKVGLVLIIVVLIVVSTVSFSNIKKPEYSDELQNVDLLVALNTDPEYKAGDSDNDGLLDWQEELYGTDPLNPDTDGDDTLDGDEVKDGRDPRIAGPNDPLLSYNDYFKSAADFETFATGTVTSQLSVDLLSQYLTLKQKDQLTDEASEKLVTEIAQSAVQGIVTQKMFTQEDLPVVTSSRESVKTYGTQFALEFVSYMQKLDSLKSLSDTVYIPAVATTYTEFAHSLAVLTVPSVVVEAHVEILNRLYETGVLLEMLSDEESDPIKAIALMGQYQARGNDSYLYITLASYFKNNGIIFDNDAARFWENFES